MEEISSSLDQSSAPQHDTKLLTYFFRSLLTFKLLVSFIDLDIIPFFNMQFSPIYLIALLLSVSTIHAHQDDNYKRAGESKVKSFFSHTLVTW